MVDAILFSSEVDLLEIRMREYQGLIDVFVIVESDLTFSGHDKPLHYKQNKEHFEQIINGTQSKIVYKRIEGLEKGLKPGSFDNEYKMRQGVSTLLSSLELPIGSLILQSDVDEIISRETIRLLKTCSTPINLHLNVKNYRYDFHFPIPDNGYWRPHISTTTGLREGGYSHGRQADLLLEGAGWHCSFCFRTLGEMRGKMLGYSHNDRVRDTGLVKMENIRKRVCEGREPFDMYPVSRSVDSSSFSLPAGDSHLDDHTSYPSFPCCACVAAGNMALVMYYPHLNPKPSLPSGHDWTVWTVESVLQAKTALVHRTLWIAPSK